ncbi:PorT family protein [Lacinutrix sp. C3R15]|uniref:type IX secretion/gliding motility protein PorT/SprT n=1 Tax=Flavobacteriaceae TaxID=49546 RepID=UPI001C088ACB|nr:MULTISPECIES: porin family protein [Flavobacteriaceae]MBU2939256.1 PorT family protein [Lacinutrix sp. C3R15]MDO6622571.1 porin family protein [Oceanihabitans sp. 1_MG-2023]
MKNILTIVITLFVFQTSSAQLFSKERIKNNENVDKARLSYGYFLGFNSYNFNFDYYENKKDIQVETSTGFNVGLVGNLRVNDYIDVRLEPGLFITSRNLIYDESYFEGIAFTDADLIREVKSTYIHIPLLLKFSTKRINNFKPFIVGGISTALNLSSNQDNPDDNSAGEFRMKKNNMYYEVGFGIDFYLFFFKFTPSVRGIFALNEEIVPDEDPNSPWTGNISSMKTRGLFINLTFQ